LFSDPFYKYINYIKNCGCMAHKFDEFYEMLKLDRKNSAWSRTNTLESRYDELIDEIKEIRQAIDNNDPENLKEELGDGLWDLLFLVVLAEEKGLFKAEDIIQSSIDKLKRRKPWIFTGEKLDIEEERRRWKEVKLAEKHVKAQQS
jgi:tetrapyrrole methylase family protein / MazG family protein